MSARLLTLVLVAALGVALTATPAAAADGTAALVGSYWQGFYDFWTGALKKQNGVVMVAIGVGALSLFIITRGKWKK